MVREVRSDERGFRGWCLFPAREVGQWQSPFHPYYGSMGACNLLVRKLETASKQSLDDGNKA